MKGFKIINTKLVNVLEDQLKDVRKKLSNTNESIMKIVDSYDNCDGYDVEFGYETDSDYQRLATMVGYYEGQIKGLEMAIELVNPLSNPFNDDVDMARVLNTPTKQEFNNEIYRLNEISYQEMIINHIQFAIENQKSYKQLMIDSGGLDYDSKVLLMTEIDRCGLQPLMNELIRDYQEAKSEMNRMLQGGF